MSDATVEELVNEAKKPGKFNIVNVIKERAYPSDDVVVYLDEEVAYRAAKLQERLRDEAATLPEEEYAALDAELNAAVEELESKKYVFSIRGISEGRRGELLELSIAQFPLEYNEQKNPFTGEVTRTEIEDRGRDSLFTNFIWAEHIVKIVSPEGDEQESLTAEEVRELRDALPLASAAAINEAIDKLRVSTAVFMASVDEDFLAKS